MQPGNSETEVTYQFERFELDPVRRVLSRDGKAISLKPKIFETLLVLVRNSGRVMAKDELMQQVWPDTIVEEVNLAHNISILRKVLGQTTDENRFIVTVPGRGYGFVAEVTQRQPGATSVAPPEATPSIGPEREETPTADAPAKKDGIVARAIFQGPFLLVVIGGVTVGIVLAVIFYGSRRRDGDPPNSQISSIAVLPFKPLVAQDRDESLEMGMADTLIARLSNIRDIAVRPISAVRHYAGLEQDAVAAGREQKVDAVIEGQIQKAGEKVRVTVRLVRVGDGVGLWTSQFDEKLTDIFQVQDSIAERVATVLAVNLTMEEKQRLTKHHTDNAEAYQFYLIGRYHLNRLTDDGFIKSVDYFQLAIRRDPNFALAHAGLAEAYNALGGFNVRRPKEVYPQARAAAVAALNLDPQLAEAHTALAMVDFTFDWDWAGAATEFKRAIEINPLDSDAHYYYSYYFVFAGQFDNALAEIRMAQELDPVSLVKLTGMAQVLLIARRYDDSIAESQKALAMDPNLGFAHWLLGLAYMYKGSYDPAIAELKKSVPLSGDSPDEPATLAQAYALSGKKTEARKILSDLEQRTAHAYISPGTLANLYWLLGDKDRAFALFDQALEDHDNMMVLLKVEPMFDEVRSDPRFAKLVRSVGFP
jgi:DNA-binding winged helix-turn-helix (wHTH) protein/TolB-like protein/Flp pilus assembly protein TadD